MLIYISWPDICNGRSQHRISLTPLLADCASIYPATGFMDAREKFQINLRKFRGTISRPFAVSPRRYIRDGFSIVSIWHQELPNRLRGSSQHGQEWLITYIALMTNWTYTWVKWWPSHWVNESCEWKIAIHETRGKFCGLLWGFQPTIDMERSQPIPAPLMCTSPGKQ